MKLIFIYGLPATGKLTVAMELAAMTGFRLFHNHLVVDLLLSVFDFGSPPFVELREDIWLSVFDQACRNQVPGLIFTFAPEATVRPDFIAKTLTTVSQAGGNVEFVELVCPVAELKRRIASPSRLQYKKLTSVSLFEELHANGSFGVSYLPGRQALHRYQCLHAGTSRKGNCAGTPACLFLDCHEALPDLEPPAYTLRYEYCGQETGSRLVRMPSRRGHPRKGEWRAHHPWIARPR